MLKVASELSHLEKYRFIMLVSQVILDIASKAKQKNSIILVLQKCKTNYLKTKIMSEEVKKIDTETKNVECIEPWNRVFKISRYWRRAYIVKNSDMIFKICLEMSEGT